MKIKSKQTMKPIYNFILLFLFSVIVIISSCKDEIPNLDDEIPDKNVSYAEHIQPVFNIKCATSSCHDDASRQGGLSLTNWASATSNPLFIFPYEPDNSKLIWAIEFQSGATVMPPLGRAALSDKERTGIRTWVAEGAKNN